MPKIKHSEMRIVDEIFDMSGGWCLDFTDRTLAEFFEDELGITIYQEKYSFNGTSKAKHIRAFIEVEDGLTVSKLLQKLWNHKESLSKYDHENLSKQRDLLGTLLQKLRSDTVGSAATKLNMKASRLDLDTVSRDLERALQAALKDPESALTSACSTLESVCRSILTELGEDLPRTRDLMTLYKAVRKPLGLTPDASDFPPDISNDVLKILGGLSTVVGGIAALRTHGGDAHGREKGYTRIDTRIATLSVHSASSLALFLIETWERKYPDTKLYSQDLSQILDR